MTLMKSTLCASALVCVAGAVAAQDTTLTYMLWSTEQVETEAPAIAAFEAANPGVTVEVQAMPPADYWPRVSALAASGDLPDVMAMSSGFVQEWAEADNLLDLTPLIGEASLEGYFESAVEIGKIDGQQVAFPQNWVAPVLYFNRSAFDAAGVDYPSADWTWDDFRAAAEALTLDENGDGTPEQYGYWVYGRYAQTDPWVFRNGGRYVTDDGSALEINEPAVNALAFLASIVDDGFAPRPQELEGIRQQDVFGMGMAAMWVDGSWNIDNTRNLVGDSFEWGIAQVPMGPDATPETAVAYAWADMLAVTTDSEQTDLAWALVQHLTGPTLTAADFTGGKVPAWTATAQSEDWLGRGQQPDNMELILEIGTQPLYTGFTRDWSAWRGYAAAGSGGLNGELDEVFNGRKPLDEALAAATAYGNDVLSR
ncbi:ABC transporter substrate-binding protein [Roseisalinus antarcticus]|uniref:Putative ABC transporter substrate-binding protein YesO n=1 Tax=Roseisalinus antarcticus TaxID=254357 RepID=A0A1Y5U1X4_9RHOB|nr:sugar ABC transporter substrate-binding protein [Roseisalinus antarcticus]SLN75035.1 Putative ABC transporter substrate-binding protein YesO [Roseisalinus antarcticus]